MIQTSRLWCHQLMNVDRNITFVPSMAIADITCVVLHNDSNITFVVSLYGNHGIGFGQE